MLQEIQVRGGLKTNPIRWGMQIFSGITQSIKGDDFISVKFVNFVPVGGIEKEHSLL